MAKPYDLTKLLVFFCYYRKLSLFDLVLRYLRINAQYIAKMAIICPKCKHQYDVTLFEFGNVVQCDCGARIKLDPKKGVIIENDKKSDSES